MKNVPIVEQLQQTECGLCCVAMLLGYYGCHTRLVELRQRYEVGRDGLKISEMSELLKSYNMQTKVYKTKLENISTKNCPCIVYWEKKHFVVVEEINLKKQTVRIVDPALGRRTISYEETLEKYTGYVVVSAPGEGFEKRRKSSNVWFKYTYLLTKNKALFSSILFFSIITYVFTLLIPIIIQKIIDFVDLQKENLNDVSYATWIWWILALSLVYIFTTYLVGKRKIYFAKAIDEEIAEKLFSHMLKLPVKFFELRSHGDILFRIQSLAIVRDTFSQKIIAFLMNCGLLLVIQIYLLFMSPVIAILAMVFAVLSGLTIMYTRKQMLESNQGEIGEACKLQTIQSELVYSIANIKMSGTEDDIYNKWNTQFHRTLDKHVETVKSNNVHTTLIASFNQIVPLIILMISMILYVNKEISMGSVIAIHSAATTFMSICVSIFTAFDDFLLSSQYLERIQEILEEKEEDYLSDGKKIECDGSIELKDVSFAFTNHSEPVLKNISMSIKTKQKVAIVGASGSGKSTLGKVLLGIYTPTQGELLYNSAKFNELNKKALRRQMGVVPQDITLLNDSIYNNIEMSRDNITPEMVKQATEIAQIRDEIEEMPMKYNTVISEMGTNISGGQRQRIGFARAVVHNPNILLLDEATSSLDTINESAISAYLQSVGCTRIVIAHRISTVIDADVIYVMEDGQIVEQGDHNTLMEMNGVYRQLYTKQIVESDIEKKVV